MWLKTLVAVAVLTSCLGPPTAIAADPDEAALRKLMQDFEAARRGNDKDAMRRLYTTDSMYFQRNGGEAFGIDAVVDLLFSRPLGVSADGAQPNPAGAVRPSKIVLDGVESGGDMGLIYGRVCAEEVGGKLFCPSRWLLVTRKDADGKWRIRADIGANRIDPAGAP